MIRGSSVGGADEAFDQVSRILFLSDDGAERLRGFRRRYEFPSSCLFRPRSGPLIVKSFRGSIREIDDKDGSHSRFPVDQSGLLSEVVRVPSLIPVLKIGTEGAIVETLILRGESLFHLFVVYQQRTNKVKIS